MKIALISCRYKSYWRITSHCKMYLLSIQTLTVLELFLTYLDGATFSADKDVNFLLRVKNRPFNDEEIFKYDTRSAVSSSAFDPTKPTTFLIHGFWENRKTKHHLKLSKYDENQRNLK